MNLSEAQGMWISPDGSASGVRVKGGPLFEAFHGITGGLWRDSARRSGRELGASKVDLARGYSSAVWAYRCIKLRADALAGVPLILLDRDGARITEHPILDLLHDVNPSTMNLGDLLRATEAAYNIWGAAYWLKLRRGSAGANGNGRAPKNPNQPRRVQWLNPQTLEPVTDPVQGIVGYKQTVDSRTRVYEPEELIVFRNFDPQDDLGGLSPLSVALNEINAELNAARFVASFFANDARPAGLLTTDQPLKEGEMERVRTWWQRLFQGVEQKWKTGIVGSGLRWQTITFPPTDLALADLRAEDRRAICAVFGVPSGLAGAWESTTYATAREQKASFYEDTMIPQMEYIAEVLNRSLLPHYPDLVVRGARLAFDVDSITALRESASEKAQRLVALFQAGIITRDEVRAGLGMPLVEEKTSPPALSIDGDAGPVQARPGRERAEGKSYRAAPTDGNRNGAAKSLQAELDRWERFAVKRIRLGRSLRAFRSTTIPPALWWRIATGLGDAQSVDDVRRIFDTASHQSAANGNQVEESAG